MESPDGPIYSGADKWFSSDGVDGDGPQGWRLDVVTLLAVIGESSIAEHAQVITASVLCLLPRIIPAPQALLKPSRPQRLPETSAKMTGVYSGVALDTVSFFANILHPLDELPALAFKVLEIKHRDRNNAGGIEVPPQSPNGSAFFSRFRSNGRTNTNLSLAARSIKGPPPDALDDEPTPIRGRATGLSVAFSDIEAGPDPPPQGITRRQTMKEKVQDFVANPTLANKAERPAIPATLWSPIHILEIFSVLLTFSIIGFAAWQKDGTAIIAVTLMATASSVVGLASWWRPILTNRSHTNKVPDGDIIIRTREGAFLLIKCTEEVARELYSGTEECAYRVGGQWYRALMGLGTFLLMASVILLGNCKWNSQIFVSGAYVVLNGMYWALGLIPKRYFWDLSRYECKVITPEDSLNAEKETNPNDPREGVKSFTRTLWWAIRETKRTAWVHRNGAAPNTPQWQKWLAEAEAAAKAGDRKWKAVARKDEIMKMSEEDIAKIPSTAPARDFDEAEQAVPAIQIHPQDRDQGKGGAF
ncbi:hypothetical protein F5B22DRAFT_635475 [Xylaria bambusicola]|uniref:uncharacterized protein n=1 Tax=Xylaria bambusicola TaxID=326684 RepID=UPI0020083A51|nr:uncharacterized protein F5B22DRAFT_635475 [Xylaria bambusicola]KAI0517968.1 hypothetical protein F5B22DRAFT_635475 [Xylaria bambusicola]